MVTLMTTKHAFDRKAPCEEENDGVNLSNRNSTATIGPRRSTSRSQCQRDRSQSPRSSSSTPSLMQSAGRLVAIKFATTVPKMLAVVDAAAATEVAFAMIPVLLTLATAIVSLGMVILAEVHPARYSATRTGNALQHLLGRVSRSRITPHTLPVSPCCSASFELGISAAPYTPLGGSGKYLCAVGVEYRGE